MRGSAITQSQIKDQPINCLKPKLTRKFIVFDCIRYYCKEKVFALSNDKINQQIDHDLSTNRNVSSNKMMHLVLVLNFIIVHSTVHFSAQK